MQFLFALLGSTVAASGTVPYIIETIKGKTKPRLVSWFTWSLLMVVAMAGSFADGQLGSALFSLLGAVATGAIVVAGLRFGDRSLKLLDIICLAGVVVGFVLWQLFNNPSIAVWAAIIIDLVGLIPTVRHAWEAPHEETLTTYILVCLGGFLTVGAAVSGGDWSVTAIGYPLYAALSLGAVAVIIRWRGKTAAKQSIDPAEQNV